MHALRAGNRSSWGAGNGGANAGAGSGLGIPQTAASTFHSQPSGETDYSALAAAGGEIR